MKRAETLRHHGGVRFRPHSAGRGTIAPAKRATRRSTPTARFPSKAWRRRSDSITTQVPLVVLIGGIIGGLTGYLMQYWISVVSYPVNVGGKPYHSWPSFIVVTFEMTILFAGISAVFGMLALNGLPMPYHPVFNSPRFAFASKDRFFLIVFSSDPKYDPANVRSFLESLNRAPSRRCPINTDAHPRRYR